MKYRSHKACERLVIPKKTSNFASNNDNLKMWWFVIFIAGIIAGFLFLSYLFELGFRNQGNLDWLMYTEWCNDYFNNNGFREKRYENETSSHPSTLFERDGYQVKVQLNAPLLIPPSLYSIDIIVNEKRVLHFPTFIKKEEVYRLLDDYFLIGMDTEMTISPVKQIGKGTSKLVRSVLGRKREYQLQFNKEKDGCWYVDFPHWPFSHDNLAMVSGADKMLELLSNGDSFVKVSVIPTKKKEQHDGYIELEQTEYSLFGGSTYQVNYNTFVEQYKRDSLWICPVTLFVLGHYPKFIYIKSL